VLTLEKIEHKNDLN